jgi:hypothetical protein
MKLSHFAQKRFAIFATNVNNKMQSIFAGRTCGFLQIRQKYVCNVLLGLAFQTKILPSRVMEIM